MGRILLAAAVGLSGIALAQTTTGTISGIVEDSTHRPILGAVVTAEDSTRTVKRSTASEGSGSWRIPALPPARYRLTVSAKDLQTVAADVEVTVDSRVRRDFTLSLAQTSSAITVTETIKVIDTESPAVGYTLDHDRIALLPLNRRDFLNLSLLVPGVAPPVQDSALSAKGSFAMHAGGAREEFNNFTLDGADNNDPYVNRYAIEPAIESIQEFKILINSYSAEYGRSGGAQVNVVTRSGSNVFHGAAYEYLRNRLFDARNFFDGAERPKYSRNQFGGSLGGPVLHDKSFFFFNYEALRERQSQTRLSAAPTDAERSGMLSQTVLDPFTRKPFPGNQIPVSRIDPLAIKMLDLYRLPVLPILTDNSQLLTARYDQHLSSRDELMVRYAWNQQHLFEPFAEASTNVTGFGSYSTNTGHNLAAQLQRTWSAHTIQTTRFAYNWVYRDSRQQNYTTDVGKLWGVSYLNVLPRDFGYPSIKIAGYSQIGDVDQRPIHRTTPSWQLQETFLWMRGAHSFKIGGEYRHTATEGYLDYYSRGSLTFSGALTGSPIGDVLLGLPTLGIQSQFNNPQSLRQGAYDAFFQDDWRLTPKLNISLGLRYEYNSAAVDPNDQMYTLDVATGKLVQVGRNGVPRAGYTAKPDAFAPRVGFAWTPAANWAVRGGYGVFFDSGMFNVNSSLYFNPPLFNVHVFFPTATSLLTLNNPFPTNGGITPPASPNVFSPGLTTAYLQNWNFTVERQLSRATTLSAGYAGSKGTHLIHSRDINQPSPGSGVLQTRRPYPAFAGIFFSESAGLSNYHSLQVNLDRRLSRSLSLLASYTWSKSIDDTSAFLGTTPDKNFPQNSSNYHAERALSSFDMRHRLTGAVVYLYRGFEFRTIYTAQSGQPFTPLLFVDNSNTGNSGSIFGNDRPNVIRNPRLSNRTPQEWFDTSAFTIPTKYTFGNAGRNIVTGPGIVNIDAGLSRKFRLSELFSLTFDAEAFNITNTAHFDLPQLYADQPSTFGKIFSAKAPRQVQFALRLGF